MEAVVIILRVILAFVFANVGSKRKIGSTWAFILSLFLGLIGWIIIWCSPKISTDFVEIKKEDEK
ncbi:MAG: hypothetical protein MJZ97_06330 [Bacteroidales bacterium]|nr:hypothetical protein [Bacteroidales bacterium]